MALVFPDAQGGPSALVPWGLMKEVTQGVLVISESPEDLRGPFLTALPPPLPRRDDLFQGKHSFLQLLISSSLSLPFFPLSSLGGVGVRWRSAGRGPGLCHAGCGCNYRPAWRLARGGPRCEAFRLSIPSHQYLAVSSAALGCQQ